MGFRQNFLNVWVPGSPFQTFLLQSSLSRDIKELVFQEFDCFQPQEQADGSLLARFCGLSGQFR